MKKVKKKCLFHESVCGQVGNEERSLSLYIRPGKVMSLAEHFPLPSEMITFFNLPLLALSSTNSAITMLPPDDDDDINDRDGDRSDIDDEDFEDMAEDQDDLHEIELDNNMLAPEDDDHLPADDE